MYSLTKKKIEEFGNLGAVNLYAVSPKKIDKTAKEKVKKQVHNILLVDNSFSMHNDIEELLKCVRRAVCSMEEEDIITVLSFNDTADTKLSKILTKEVIYSLGGEFDPKNFECFGCTCFSNALKEMRENCLFKRDICTDLNILLFTDGMSCCSLSSEEDYDNAIKTVNMLKEDDGFNIINFSAIGFRNNVNLDFLHKITSMSKYGKYLLSDKIADYNSFFTTNYTTVKEDVGDSITFEFDKEDEDKVFTLYTYGSNLQKSLLKKGSFKLDSMNYRKNRFVILKLSGEPLKSLKVNGETIDFEEREVKTFSAPSLEKTLFGFAKEFYYENYRSYALDTAICVNDKCLATSILSSYTLDERRKTQELMKKCYLYPNNRYAKGMYSECLSTDIDILVNSQYCILDLLKDLSSLGFLYVPSTENYHRVSAKTTNAMKDLMRKDKKTIYADMKQLTFNETRLNISIPYIIEGKVYISDKDQKEMNLPEIIPTKMYRNETLILNGNLNVEKFKVKAPDDWFSPLSRRMDYKKLYDYLNTCQFNLGSNTYIIDLKRNPLPVVTRGFKCYNEDELLQYVYGLTLAKARQKVYNAEISDSVNSIMVAERDSSYRYTGKFDIRELSEEQLVFLKENYGLNSKLEFVGAPVVEKSHDKYKALSVKFTIKGMAGNLPPISKLKEKIENGKKMNILEQEMKYAYECIEEANGDEEELKKLKATNKKLIHDLSANLSTSKIAKFLTGDSWTKFNVGEDGKEFYENDEILKDTRLLMDTKWIDVEI